MCLGAPPASPVHAAAAAGGAAEAGAGQRRGLAPAARLAVSRQDRTRGLENFKYDTDFGMKLLETYDNL